MIPHSAIVIGAGIVGLATARALAVRGYNVTVFERDSQAVGASIRNFGMIWPIGQPQGLLLERAMLSRSIWKSICDEARLWYAETGSLHIAYNDDELDVMQEFADASRVFRNVEMVTPSQTLSRSPAVNSTGLKGALWSGSEMIVEARDAIKGVTEYLRKKYNVRFYFNTAITAINHPSVYGGNHSWSAEEIFICSGADFETLYPERYTSSGITKCKLQMMRIGAQSDHWNIGPSLCGALSLIHYSSFKIAPSLPSLYTRFESVYPDYIKWGIHVMASQNGNSEITIGDSHEYGLTHDPFNRDFINKLILDYLATFARFKNTHVIQSWNGIYPKMNNGETELICTPADGVTIINGLGGAGMTLSFGLAEEFISQRKPVNHTTILHPYDENR
jgi:FAD dependent oxidoreductase TIGR03364